MSLIRLLVSDLDSTLLHRDKSVSDFTLQTLRALQEKGYLVGLATARSEASARELVPNFEADLIVSSGGAVARSHTQTLFSRMLPKEQAETLLLRAANYPNVGKITAHVEEGVYWNVAPGAERPPGYAHHQYFDFHEPFSRAVYCSTIATADEAWIDELAASFPDCEHISYTGEDLHRFAAKNSGKVDALKACCEHFGFSMDNVMAFGDDVNDIEMISACGEGIAMQNAIPAVKEVASFVLPWNNEEDGVARYVSERFLS